MIQHLTVKNFTAISELEIDFSPKINVIIGENSTGKTHLLKLAYFLCNGGVLFKDNPGQRTGELEKILALKLQRLFLPLDGKIGEIHRHGTTEKTNIKAEFTHGQKFAISFLSNSRKIYIDESANYDQNPEESVFIRKTSKPPAP